MRTAIGSSASFHGAFATMRCNRLDALALARQLPARAVPSERSTPIQMNDDFTQMLDILSKTRRHTLSGPQIHQHRPTTSGVGRIAEFAIL
jgi:hypothetical protein